MKNSKFLILSAITIIIFSGGGFLLAKNLISNQLILKQAEIKFNFKEQNYDQNQVDQLRFKLLYQNQELSNKAAKFQIDHNAFANNFKVKNDSEQGQFIVSFADRNEEVARKMLGTATKNILADKDLHLATKSKIQIKNLKQSPLQIGLIGLITGGAIAIAILFSNKNIIKLKRE